MPPEFSGKKNKNGVLTLGSQVLSACPAICKIQGEAKKNRELVRFIALYHNKTLCFDPVSIVVIKNAYKT